MFTAESYTSTDLPLNRKRVRVLRKFRKLRILVLNFLRILNFLDWRISGLSIRINVKILFFAVEQP